MQGPKRGLAEAKAKLEETRREINWLIVAQMHHALNPRQRELYRRGEISARAEAHLRRLEVSHLEGQKPPSA